MAHVFRFCQSCGGSFFLVVQEGGKGYDTVVTKFQCVRCDRIEELAKLGNIVFVAEEFAF